MLFRKGGCVNFSLVVWAAALVLLLAVGTPVFAQNASGTILGVVKDAQGGAVNGATVTIRNTETGLTRSLTTGDDGSYRAPALPVGGYSVKVERTGFKSSTHDGLLLNVTDEMAVNFALEVGSSTVEVVVTGELPQVETTTSTLGGLVDEKRMADLPLNGRNYADLTLLQPGVTRAVNVGNINSATQGTWMSSNGAPLRANNFTLDGARLNNQQGANSASAGGNTLGVDGIREYKVVTDMFGAEYGLGMGSQVVMTSKGGSNQWHGDAFDYLRNAIFDANLNRPAARQHASTTIIPRPQHEKNNFGGAFGGPIKKDKAFFFATYEGIREVAGIGSPTTHVLQARCYDQNPGANFHQLLGTPTDPSNNSCADLSGGQVASAVVFPAELLPYPNVASANAGRASSYNGNPVNRNGENFGQIRYDQNVSGSDSLFVRYTDDEFHANNDSKYPEYGVLQTGRNHFATIGENHIFSASLLNSARISFSRTAGFNTNYVKTANAASSGIAAWAACPTLTCPGYSFTNDINGNPNPTGAFIIGFGAPGNFGATGGNAQQNVQNIYTFSDDVFYSKGRHALKFGILFNRFNQGSARANAGNNSVSGEVQWGGQDFLLGGIAFPFWDARTLTPQTDTYFIYNTVGLYAQDDFRVSSHLTLNLGLRYEFNTTPYELNGRQYTHLNIQTDTLLGTQHTIMQNDSLKNFSPRIGFAWDIFGTGKTAIRGGFGLYQDVGSIGTVVSQHTFASPPVASYWVASAIYPTAPAFSVPWPNPATVPAQFQALHTTDYYVKQPHLLQYNLTAQQQLPWNLALQVGYVGSRGINLFRLTEENPFKQVACTGPNCIAGQPFWGMDPTSPQGRINPNFGTATEVTTGADSWYNALEVGLTMKNFHGLEMQTAYTFSRNVDTTQGQQYVFDCFSAQGSGQGIDPTNPKTDKGPTCFDAAHNLRVNFLYHFPSPKSNSFLSKALGGWWMGNIISVQSGYPFNVNTAGLISNNGVFAGDQGERPNIVTKANFATADALAMADSGQHAVLYDPKKAITGDPSGWFNPLMFTLVAPNADAAGGACNTQNTPTGYRDAPGSAGSIANNSNFGDVNFGPTCYFGYLGNEPRNDLRGAGLREWDLSINKDTKLPFLGETGMLEFRAEMFNLLNHANWGFISNTIFTGCAPFNNAIANVPPNPGNGNCAGSNEPGTPAAQTPTVSNFNGVGPMRQIQFALKLIF